ncbi:unnamed protein product, partial [Didymodactylos carnosus]
TSRKLPTEWYQQEPLNESNEYDEQLVEHITFEKELDNMEEDTLRRQHPYPRTIPSSPIRITPLYTTVNENLTGKQQQALSSKVNLNNIECDDNNVFNDVDK